MRLDVADDAELDARRRVILTTSMAPGAARIPQRIAAPSKAGPAGAAVASEPVAVAEHDLAVRADVEEQADPRVAVHARGEEPGDDVAADVGAEGGEDDRAGPLVHVHADLGGEDLGEEPAST